MFFSACVNVLGRSGHCSLLYLLVSPRFSGFNSGSQTVCTRLDCLEDLGVLICVQQIALGIY